MNKEILLLIRNQRKAKGLSQIDMSRKMNIVLKTYQNIESGATRLDVDRLIQIAELIELDLGRVFKVHQNGTQNVERELYTRILTEKDHYIAKLEDDIKFYREILRDNKAF